MQLIWIILSAAVFLLAACTENSIDSPELSNPETIAPDIVEKEESPMIPPDPQPPKSEERESKIAENPLPAPAEEAPPAPAEVQIPTETSGEEIDWGQEIDLAEMIAKAKSGEIREIQWHVMPNVLRAQAFNNRIFHLKNENKGVDLRNTLIGAGVKVGRGGVTFRHVF
jgi:hypothetical protein